MDGSIPIYRQSVCWLIRIVLEIHISLFIRIGIPIFRDVKMCGQLVKCGNV